MTVSHDPAECRSVEYALPCIGCGNIVLCSADTDREACDDIDQYLDGSDFRCAACRAMPSPPQAA